MYHVTAHLDSHPDRPATVATVRPCATFAAAWATAMQYAAFNPVAIEIAPEPPPISPQECIARALGEMGGMRRDGVTR